MAEVRVEDAVEREGDRVVIEGVVCRGTVCHRRAGEAGDELVCESDPLRRAQRVPRAEAVVFLDRFGVAVALPFADCE